ncbi:hypothetical protein [Microcystis aeruginosa]|uniref:hypothetical protein n=1 Tax=Microcystis aeruginosa TaxID=1126 RepID=UPI0018824B03|nr:hypothetical protein [Microcystis aeruginosa]MBE8996182.1 hypothetical protein [Microcystis aeruginosa LEGE 91341]
MLDGVVKSKDDPNQLGTEITLIARIALHLSYSDLTTPARLQQLYDLMAWIALVIAVPRTFVSVPLLTNLLGKEYTKAGRILVWHIWSRSIVFVGIAFNQ